MKVKGVLMNRLKSSLTLTFCLIASVACGMELNESAQQSENPVEVTVVDELPLSLMTAFFVGDERAIRAELEKHAELQTGTKYLKILHRLVAARPTFPLEALRIWLTLPSAENSDVLLYASQAAYQERMLLVTGLLDYQHLTQGNPSKRHASQYYTSSKATQESDRKDAVSKIGGLLEALGLLDEKIALLTATLLSRCNLALGAKS
jgi:hypothetical protein